MKRLPKLNSVHWGGTWLLCCVLVGAVIPGLWHHLLGGFPWPLCVLGGLGLLTFGILRAVERRQDSDRFPYYEKDLAARIPYDPQTQEAVFRVSVCTGETVAGFRDRETGKFREVLLIRSPEDAARFRKIYGLTEIRTEY